jgi:lipopolysaccharide/colanic/teichoic acid biosynthesis glycosyltransferase
MSSSVEARFEQHVAPMHLRRRRDAYFVYKRVLDLLISGIAVLVLAPLLLLIAILIKLDSCGPVIFAQKRVGAKRVCDGEDESWYLTSFTCYKFRTMRHNCDPTIHEAFMRAFIEGRVDGSGMEKPAFKTDCDPRVTRLGRLLRKSSLDELPQLFNVLLGQMSLVGPRPPIEYEVRRYTAEHRQRLAAVPGITGLWQVKGRSRVSFDETVRMDVEYIQHQSLWLDLKILILTIPAVLFGRGAS